MKGFLGLVLLVLLVSYASPISAGVVICKKVKDAVQPCVPYLTASVSSPSSDCCQVLTKFGKRASGASPKLKETACNCLKKAAKEMNVMDDRVSKLSKLCKSDFNMPFSTKMECSK
ncbi:hypothetical protein K2173_023095 [Erythroxylum novogranatense]|uniref:Bifunctional inhibitor/plant lipid transfer protein/seed storage helical domain-containing protein n=1 Tax=Erythroxylum novogranatense TaxID=1862640 RepID=A0AAV8T849_9ROSI|nr:hypothetical protein K2173_023095 [Erythroxylum novogranatense]